VSRRSGADLGKLTRHLAWGQLQNLPERSARPTQTAQILASLAADPEVGVGAQIHLGILQFLIGKLPDSAQILQQAAVNASSDFERNFALLMTGLALSQILQTH